MQGEVHEECGIYGVFGMDAAETAHRIYAGLYTLQHRGQESCGIAVNLDREVKFVKEQGQVREVFNDMILNQLTGTMGIGHVRYGTSDSVANVNAQPLVTRYHKGPLAVAHNGSITNQKALRDYLQEQGAVFQTTADSEIILQLIIHERMKGSGTSIEDAVLSAMDKLRGAYSVLLMNGSKLIAFRDPAGVRPLCIGKNGDAFVFASESCALDTTGAMFIRDVKPGEVIVVDQDGLRSMKDRCGGGGHLCVFEFIYNARTDSIIDGQSVYKARQEAGRILAKTYPVDADVVVAVPDSAADAAHGYALESGIPIGRGLVINRYVGRTFIVPGQSNREAAVRIKFNAMRAEVEGKRVVLVDDSMVRGTTVANLVNMLKEAGATQVHMRIASPPFLWPCYFGTDVPDRDDLPAVHHSLEEIRKMIGADSIGYLPLDQVKNIAPMAGLGFCDACFSGNYPIPLE